MGIVYRARQVSLNREIALKVLPDYARHGRTAVRRFQNEAQAAARLNHTNIVPIYAQGEYEGNYYYAMKLVEGASLDTVMKSQPELLSSTHQSRSASGPTGPASWRGEGSTAASGGEKFSSGSTPPLRRTRDDYCFIASLMAGVAEGLAHAHANGVIHRDIKPHNLLFGPDRQLYITDFGLAHLTSEPHLTITGEVLGTPSYMSPEQARGDVGAINDCTDVYSFGATLYELVTGHQPFEGKSHHQIIDAVCHEEPPRPRCLDRRIPVDLETICLRAIEKDPRRRYDSAAALAEDLHRFAEDRPILSRRIGVMERAAKWTRRHKTAAAAAVVMAALVVVSTGWALSAAAADRRDGNRFVQSAYDQLVHRNFDRPRPVIADVEQAEAFGATNPRLGLVRAVLHTRASEHEAAIEELESLLEDNPDNLEGLYSLAWVLWRSQRNERFYSTLHQAEDLGGPQTAEEWFFRGLALQRYDAQEAIRSYRTAKRMRTADDKFFPQADLHFARASNQQMFATQSLGTFEEAESMLSHLVWNEYYPGYAHYLLSITHRLAAEVYEANPEERNESLARHHFEQALHWAREGRKAEPSSNRPPTAEALCLERLGRFDEALEARSRAVDLARNDEDTKEGYLYRWRLHYWLGHLDEALRDLDLHATYLPEDPESAEDFRLVLSNTYFYPALVHAEGGDLERALELVRAGSEQPGFSPEAVLLSAAYLRILGESDEASTLLGDRMDFTNVDSGEALSWADEWKNAIYAYAADQVPFEFVEELAREARAVEEPASETWNPRKMLGEAYFHAGAKALARGRRTEALLAFQEADRSWDGAINFRYHGRIMFEQLAGDADWPGWIRVGQDGEAEPSGPGM